MPDTKPPTRRDAIIRIRIVVGVLAIVFGIILPRYIDYQDVIASLQGLTLQDFLLVAVFGLIAWFADGRGVRGAYPGSRLGPRDAGVGHPRGHRREHPARTVEHGRPVGRHPRLGPAVQETTGGILLYGIFDQLSRFGLMVVAGLVLVAAEATNRPVTVEQA